MFNWSKPLFDWLKRLSRYIQDLFDRLLPDPYGGIAPFAALSLIPMVLGLGVAIDVARGYMVKNDLKAALDASALAVGSIHGDEATLKAKAKNFFEQNFPEHDLLTLQDPELVIDGEIMRMTGRVTVNTAFMQVVGVDSFEMSQTVEVVRETKGMELALILDNTGSMKGTPIESLRQASRDLVDILFGEELLHPHLKVAVVPYASVVNLGEAAQSLVPAGSATYNPNSSSGWKGCVKTNAAPEDTTDSPANLSLQPFIWPSTWGDNNYPPINANPDACNSGTGPNLGCPTPILPLTNVRADVDEALTAMRAWCRGGTISNIGMLWGWRVLSPGAPFTEGLPFHTPGYEKVAILMTDGINQFFKGSSYQCSDVTAYGRVCEGKTGANSNNAAVNIINNRMLSVCASMKQDGIKIYTVVFNLNNSTVANLYKTCASDPSKFFNSPTQTDLQNTFRAIANDLSRLRIKT